MSNVWELPIHLDEDEQVMLRLEEQVKRGEPASLEDTKKLIAMVRNLEHNLRNA